MAKRPELEPPDPGLVREQATNGELDFISQGYRESARFYSLWVPMSFCMNIRRSVSMENTFLA